MADIRTEEKEGRTVITMSGEMTVEHAEALKGAFTQSLEKAARLVVDMSNVTAIDLACLQVLCSAYKTSAGLKKTFSLEPGCPDILKRVAEEAGFSRDAACVPEDEGTFLWTGM